jgi:hypothetical protein
MISFPIDYPRFKTANDEEGKGQSGSSPLFMAAMSGNVEVARALVTKHKANVHVGIRDANTVTGFEPGATALHVVKSFGENEGNGELVELLLNAGADINVPSKQGL